MSDLKAAWIEPQYLRIRLNMLTARKSHGVVKCMKCPVQEMALRISDDWVGIFDNQENLHGAVCPNCADKLQSHNLRYGLTNTRRTG